MAEADYSTVTEVTGYNVTSEQLQRLYTRYRFAGEFCENKDVLEVACGSGQGLGYLAKKAKRVVGGDIDQKLLRMAAEYYRGRDKVELKALDAQRLPFADKSFDVIILYEAIYYLKEPADFIREAYRVLRSGGVLIICTANKDSPGFNPSPYSHKYFSLPELFALLRDHGFIKIESLADCQVRPKGAKDKLVSLVKKTAVRLHLVPKTMKGKEFLKRVFFGKLSALPAEVYDGMTEYSAPVPVSWQSPNYEYKVVYALGYK